MATWPIVQIVQLRIWNAYSSLQGLPLYLCSLDKCSQIAWSSTILPSNSTSTVYRWWKKVPKVFSKEQKPTFDGLMMYFWWIIWKERIRRIFQQESKEVVDGAYLIKEDFHLHQAATSLRMSSWPFPLVVFFFVCFWWFYSIGVIICSFASFIVVLRSDKASIVLGLKFFVSLLSFFF